MFDLIRLFDAYADSDTVYARLNKNLLVFVTRNCKGVEEHFRGCSGFNLGDIVSL